MTVPVLAVRPRLVLVLGLCLSSPSQLHPPALSTAPCPGSGWSVVSPEAARGRDVKLNLRVLMP